MINPLNKRFSRQLKHGFGKYLGIFLLISVSIALVSGFLVAASSIERIFNEMPETYHIEDGRFTCGEAIDDEARAAVEDLGTVVYDNFSHDVECPLSGAATTMRIYCDRSVFDKPALYEGSLPADDNEIAIDQTYAMHHGLQLGNVIELQGQTFTICGLIVLPDYCALFESNSDFLMNDLTFCVGVVSEDGFKRFDGAPIAYTYAYFFNDAGLSTAERTTLESTMAKTLSQHNAAITDLIDAESNKGINYAGEDCHHDQIMYEVLLLLIIVIMAFIFVVLTASTIEEESSAIGTLLASGYRRRELVAHYLFLPAVVGLAACLVGNIAGYALLADPMRALYYNSYSLPPYHAYFNLRVFLVTTVIPYVMLIGITLWGLLRKTGCTPLQFLRHDTAHRPRSHTIKLPTRLGYISRFRLRIFLRNLPNFITLFFGIMISSLLLVFGLAMMPVMQDYADNLASTLPAGHIYSLKAPLELRMTDSQQEVRDQLKEFMQRQDGINCLQPAEDDPSQSRLESGADGYSDGIDELLKAAVSGSGGNSEAERLIDRIHPVAEEGSNSENAVEQAEKIAVGQLEVSHKWGSGKEVVTVYGIQENSRYWDSIDVSDGKVVVGTGLGQKCGITPGFTKTFYDKYTDENFALDIAAEAGSGTDTNVYMSIDTFNELFGNDAGYFNAYASDDSLSIETKYLSNDATPADMEKIGIQMTDSMGGIMQFMVFLSVFIFFIVMYLLTKTVIERSARSIAYMKVFGYSSCEINRLYVRSITFSVVASLIISLPVIIWFVTLLCEVMFMEYSGNFVINIPWSVLCEDVLIGFATYLLVAVLHVRHIKRMPLSLALKVQE